MSGIGKRELKNIQNKCFRVCIVWRWNKVSHTEEEYGRCLRKGARQNTSM